MDSVDDQRRPILILGMGNVLLRDDGLGPILAARLVDAHAGDPRVEILDGGTQGLALLGQLEDRRAILILDACALGQQPGTVHYEPNPMQRKMSRGIAAHEGNASELLAAAALCGSLPPWIGLLGIEPLILETGIGLSEPVENALEEATRLARSLIDGLLSRDPLPGIVDHA